ncbi:methyl-accepting chemotaxis protein [Shimia sp. MMG029]|uniref:methyl-accepting chemotaxis protein n=1 Tax=Shimia sp. MMG029 TaxID=3021978 RepID=UPI0022FDCA38|nr:methyl-accepting chemotaxis protein [Shimia sp. MMG029]MDA5558741.1 methyl-accepting chemotaxis protein [Shimia sp. MMG029]
MATHRSVGAKLGAALRVEAMAYIVNFLTRLLDRFLGFSIMGRLLLPIVGCIVVFFTSSTLWWMNLQTSTLKHAFENEVVMAQTFVAPPVAAAVWDFNADGANGAIAGIVEIEDALFAKVFVDGEVFAEMALEGTDPAGWDSGVSEVLAMEGETARLSIEEVEYIKFPVRHSDGSVVGEMVIGFDHSKVVAVVNQLYMQSLIVGVAMVLVMAFIVYIIAASVTRPLSGIIERIDGLRQGDTEGDVPSDTRKDELGRLARAVVEFVQTIKANKELEEQSKTAAREQSEVVGELADGLNNLAQGLLSHRITAEVGEDYEMLLTDFNKTAEALDDVIGRVLATISQIEDETGSMAEGTHNLSKRTESQAATLEETAAAISQITESVQNATDQTKSVEATVDATKAEAMRGGDIVKRAVGAMQDIEESAGKISEINRVIEDISFQTNLLALNAGVEAARAGDSGRGFAVVASEVRSLALRSATSANEIKELIDNSTDKVQVGVELVDAAGKAIEEIITKIEAVSKLAVQIAEGSRDQATAITEINAGVMDLDRVTQQNASLVDRSSAQGRALQEAASELAELVASFRPSSVDQRAAREAEHEADAEHAELSFRHSA